MSQTQTSYTGEFLWLVMMTSFSSQKWAKTKKVPPIMGQSADASSVFFPGFTVPIAPLEGAHHYI